MEEAKEYLKIREVARRYNISPSAILNKLKAGKLKGIKLGGSWRLRSEQFEEMENA